MITAKEAREQVMNNLNCEDELDEIEYHIKRAISANGLHISSVFYNISAAKLEKLIGILEEKGYKTSYSNSNRNSYCLYIGW